MLDLSNIPFIPGLELNLRFHDEVIGPLINRHYPHLPYAAGWLGEGSDVLGFDTPMSRDHAWGPQLSIFLDDADLSSYREPLENMFRNELPVQFLSYPTNYKAHEDGTLGMFPIDQPPVKHHISITTVREFFSDYLDYDPSQSLTLEHWLTFPEQRLRTIRSGRVFHDDSGELSAIRSSLDYYPHELWLYLLAVAWRRIDQEEPFMGRAGEVGDELGSRLIAARQVNNIVRLCFLMERQYAPYSKWLGSAFSRLACASKLSPLFEQVWKDDSWEQRQSALSSIYVELALQHNALGLTLPLSPTVSDFHGRPYLVIHSDRFVTALLEAISDEHVAALPAHLGHIDQFVDSTDVLSYPKRFSQIRELFSKL
jgi:hypothetical protein